MIIECCSQERTYSRFYGPIGERIAKSSRLWTEFFEESFRTYYGTLRKIAKYFGHMLSSDALGWHVFSVIHLNEEETTASSRIFVKFLFQDLSEAMGTKKLVERFKDPCLQKAYLGMFPKDNPRNTRFSINYFTSIGMGQVTEDMREHLRANVSRSRSRSYDSRSSRSYSTSRPRSQKSVKRGGRSPTYSQSGSCSRSCV